MEGCRSQADSGILSHRGSTTAVEEAGSGLIQAESSWAALEQATDRSHHTATVEVVRTNQARVAGHSHSSRELVTAVHTLRTTAVEEEASRITE
jgi:hypothetical protein